MRVYRRELLSMATLATAVVALFWCVDARAATLTVNSNADPPGYNGPSCTLRMAVAAASQVRNACGQGSGSGDTIQLGGRNANFVTLNPFVGPLVINNTMTIQGNFGGRHANYNDAVISGDPNNSGGQLIQVSSNANLTLSYLRLTGGSDINVNGGALEILAGTATLNTVQVDHCTAWGGGAICVEGNGALTLNSSSLHDNHAAEGGAVFNSGTVGVVANNTTFSNNAADQNPGNGLGGAISSIQADLSLNTCTLSGNKADYGGALYNTTFIVIKSSTFDSNVGYSGGGALYSDRVELYNCTLSGNSTTRPGSNGGAIYYTALGDYKCYGNTIAHNRAVGNGGGLWLGPPSGTVEETGNIIAYNTAGQQGPDVFGDASFFSQTIDLVTSANGVTNWPSGWIVKDPKLGTFGSVNQSPKLYPLLAGSPAIDVLDLGWSLFMPVDDQRRLARPVDGLRNGGGKKFDLGSYEYSPP